MTVQACYEVLGANYRDVMSRLIKEERVEKFLKKFLEDKSFGMLEVSMEEGNVEVAFRAAHTLKGVSQNLSLDNLYGPAQRLSDYLKENRELGGEVQSLFDAVKEEYFRTTEVLRQL